MSKHSLNMGDINNTYIIAKMSIITYYSNIWKFIDKPKYEILVRNAECDLKIYEANPVGYLVEFLVFT